MKKILISILTIFLSTLILFGCGSESEEVITDNRLHSDITAGEFLPGYWTDGMSDYIYVVQSELGLLSWQTNLPVENCTLYSLSDGVLIGKNQGEDETIEETPVLNLEIINDDTILVKCLSTDEEFTFIRDSFDVDSENISDDYVFWTIDRAANFFDGEWMDSSFNYFIITINDDGSTNFQTSLPFESSGEYMDFANKEMCLVSADESGIKSFTPIFSFHIIDRDTIEIFCKSDGKTYSMQRTTAEVDSDNIDTDYVFFCQSRAFPFLKGLWKTETNNHYFEVAEEDGQYTWSTDFSIPSHLSYTICGGKLIGVDSSEEDGSLVTSDIYSFRIISKDQIEITIVEKDKTYVLNRIADEDTDEEKSDP